jgi:sortase A
MNARTQSWLARGLLATGLLLLGTVAAISFLSSSARREAEQLDAFGRGRRGDLAEHTRALAKPGSVIGSLTIARIGIDVPLVESTRERALLRGVGHVEGTRFPGEDDNVGLAGHRDTHFRKLGRVRRGDHIRVRTPDGQFTYRVDSTFVVTPDRGDLLNPTGRPMLTLVTCYPFRWIGSAPKRFIVRASQVEGVAAEAASSEGR